MTTPDLSHLEALARAVQAADDRADGHQTALASDAFHAAASPSTILSLVDRVRQLEAALTVARDALGYNLEDLPMPEKTCDARIWGANMAAWKVLTAELAKLAEGK
jgi:hypothetical protein